MLLFSGTRKESTHIKYTGVQVFLFMSACVHKALWSSSQRDLVCSLTVCWRRDGCLWTGNVSSRLFLGGFSEKVKLLCSSDSAETLSLRIQLDYSGQAMKINQNISAFSERAPELPEIYNNCIVTAATLAGTEQDGGLSRTRCSCLDTNCMKNDGQREPTKSRVALSKMWNPSLLRLK